ncbi:conserved protein of unknown function [Tenacibaculum sp. 190130A14a]|uniref:Lipoprotein n=1 Tax=Tenacibaculum polynesiense TaxID=3137857 RepID=A0ABP1F1T1_9FLAO
MRLLFLFACLLILANCKNNKHTFTKTKNCVELIVKKDDSLGSIRNHDSKKISLSSTIDKYISSVEKLHFSDCSKDFNKAFQNHLSAWKDMKAVTDNHTLLRGEMHSLFDSIKQTNDSLVFTKKLTAIFDTWKTVEIAIEPFQLKD